MSLRTILIHPDTRLRKKCELVKNFDSKLEKLTQDMLETMYDAPGIGLAAPQIGVMLQVFVMDCAIKDEEPNPFILINPSILWHSEETSVHSEGCLSIPEQYEEVTRPKSVKVSFQNVKAYELFKKEKLPSNQKLNSIGSYSNGCLAGGIKLPESGNTWQAMRLSRNRNWGHKNTLNFVRELSQFASSLDGWKGLYIGDISQARGGPFETGHVSHQIGLDVDIWMLPAKTLDLSKNSRENLSSVSIKSLDSKNVNTNWSIQHAKILKKAAKNSLVDRIFVSAVAKISMCENEKGDKSWLKKIRPWYGHDTHFHVRLKCPENSIDCIKQIPTVNELSDDRYGCDETLNWWVTEFLEPKKPLTKKEKEALKSKRTPKDYTMADLPLKCGAVIKSP